MAYMFRTERERARICRALLGSLGLEGLWTEEGPTQRACDYFEKGSPLSGGEDTMLRAAFSVWNGMTPPGWKGDSQLSEFITRVDDDCQRVIGTMLLAMANGREAVDRWLAEYEPRREPAEGSEESSGGEHGLV